MAVKVTSKADLAALELSETRIVLLYSTRQEGSDIMKWAAEAGLTGDSFVWVATQSVIGEIKEALPELPAGMLGKLTPFITWKNANKVGEREEAGNSPDFFYCWAKSVSFPVLILLDFGTSIPSLLLFPPLIVLSKDTC